MSDRQQKAIAPFQTSEKVGDRSKQNSSVPNSSNNSNFRRSGKNNPCPVCSRTKDGDCSWNDEVVFCHTYVDQDAKISGYVYRGVKDIWGQYFPVSNQSKKPTRPKSEKDFIYKDEAGNQLVKVTRIDDGSGKKKIFQSHWDGEKWVKKLNDTVKSKVRLYQIQHSINQEAIANQQPILIVEGEGKVEELLKLGIAATCSIGGAGKWQQYGYPNYLEDLQGATVVLCPDRDVPGLKHCLEIEQDFPNAQWLYAFPDSPEWNNLPKNGGLDIADWIAQEKPTAEQILERISPKRLITLDTEVQSKPQKTESEPKTLTDLLLEIAEQGQYFHTACSTPYVDIVIDGVRKTFPVKHKLFKMWLMRELFVNHKKTASSEALKQVLTVLESKACFEGQTIETHLRIAEHEGKVYLDLGTDDWKAVEVSETGWKIVSDYPIRFRRPDTLFPLPIPDSNGTIDELRELLNLDEESWLLMICWLMFSLYPKYPHPILIIHGEQGTGKSYAAKTLKGLVDPCKAPLIPKVADLRNLAISADNRWIVVYDNLSHLSIEQSDALCRISTGGGFSTRTLFENNEETVFEFIRPQIVTGIDSLANRGDLLERAILVKLQRISDDCRATEAELDYKLQEKRSRILGGLLNCLSQTLKILPTLKVDRLPRMADFARFAIAVEMALELPSGSFLKAYGVNRQEAHENALEASPIAIAIQRFMEQQSSWTGTTTELVSRLENFVDEKTVKGKNWAGNARALGKALAHLAPDLRGIGIEFTCLPRSSSRRLIQLEKQGLETSQTSQTSYSNSGNGFEDDIQPDVNVIQPDANVIGDKSNSFENLTSEDVIQNVIFEMPENNEFQIPNDKNDIYDNNKSGLSNLDEKSTIISVGDRVLALKKGKWLPATVLSIPDPKQGRSYWGVLFEGEETQIYIWKSEDIRLLNGDPIELL